MRKQLVNAGCILLLCVLLSGCGAMNDLVSELLDLKSEKKTSKKTTSSQPMPEVLCLYAHYFRARDNDYSQWWYPGKDPTRILGPESWRRDLWIGRAGDYPYIGPYDNVEDTDVMRWHIRLAKAAGITAFLLAINNWEDELPQTERLLNVAAEEDFKIGFLESHSFLGAVPRSIFDGKSQPIRSRKYVGYGQITEKHSQSLPLVRSGTTSPYKKPTPRSLRNVPVDALNRASERVATMLNQQKSHPAYLRVDGKPIIVIPYMDMNLESEDLKTLIHGIEANAGEDLYVVAIIPAVYWYFTPEAVPGTGITQEWADTGADAFTHWTPNGMVSTAPRVRQKAVQFNVKDSRKWKKDAIIPVMPGFDDDAWRPGDEPAPTSPRQNGQAWKAQLEVAIKARPRFIMIQAWNEWHEGAQIEPSTHYSDPYLYLKILAQKLKKPWQAPALPSQNHVDSLRQPYLPY